MHPLGECAPSNVMAYFRMDMGRPVTTRCKSASLASWHARAASAAHEPPLLGPAASPSTST